MNSFFQSLMDFRADGKRAFGNTHMPLEVCLGSKLALGSYASIAEHPVGRLLEAGCTIVLGTDDPGFFDTDLAKEHDLALKADPGLGIERVSTNAIAAAFCDEATKAVLCEMLASRRLGGA